MSAEPEVSDVASSEAVRTGVWRRGRWDWAYRFKLRDGDGSVFGCGFATRELAREAMNDAKQRYGVASAEARR